jgi:integrase
MAKLASLTPSSHAALVHQLLDSIETMTPVGLRDRALIALMVYASAPIGAALAMKVEDVFVQDRRLWVQLREKGGKAHAMPCHQNLAESLVAYLDGTGLRDDPKRALFPSLLRATGRPLTCNPMHLVNAHAMIRRRAKAAGVTAALKRSLAKPPMSGCTKEAETQSAFVFILRLERS